MRFLVPAAAAALVACAPARPAGHAAPTVAIARPAASASADPTPPPSSKAPVPSKASIERGHRVYLASACNACHDYGIGPPLRKMAGSTLKLADGRQITVDSQFVRGAVLDPEDYPMPGYEPVMPTYRGALPAGQLDDLVAYVMSR